MIYLPQRQPYSGHRTPARCKESRPCPTTRKIPPLACFGAFCFCGANSWTSLPSHALSGRCWRKKFQRAGWRWRSETVLERGR